MARYLILFSLICVSLLQSQPKFPHGKTFNYSCSECHTTDSWKINSETMNFNHKSTGYDLKGLHSSLYCTACHSDLIFSHIGVQCSDCHPDIHGGNLGFNCESCHTPYRWDNNIDGLEIHMQTSFPLSGVHALIDCESCHINAEPESYSYISSNCMSCHQKDYFNSENPQHLLAGFSTTCLSCHIPSYIDWNLTQYQHMESFPLTLGHGNLSCTTCHENNYSGTVNDCYSCHQNEYEGTTNPNHQQFGFLTDCETCHTPASWEGSTYDHFAETGFSLNGAHLTQIGCLDCHINNQLTGLPTDCMGCHLDDYNTTTSPNHSLNNFDENCLECHTEISWIPSTFNHSNYGFDLVGGHAGVQCISCHINGYVAPDNSCWSCHEDDYNAVSDPNHVNSNFDKTCENCHTVYAWSPAEFDHNTTNFPLTGAHINASCMDCHQDQFTGTPVDCYSCHSDDYLETTDPNHNTAQFPHYCEDCHSTTAWIPADWDHDTQYFPIYSGKHKGEWNSCADCHNIPGNYEQFECINCHEHSKTKMDDEHDEVRNYQYISTACYDCHPKGEADD